MQVSQDNPTPEALDAATKVLEAGRHCRPPIPSYGLVCAATPTTQLTSVYLKSRIARPPKRSAVRGGSRGPSPLRSVGSAWALALVGSFWPGALTLVVTATDALPAEYLAPTGTVALRCPNSALVRELARRVGALAQTSANTHGEPSATSGASVEPQIVDAVDLTLDGGPAPLAIASTIVDCTGAAPRVLREGAIAEKDILRVAGA